jgi:transposase
MLHAGLDLSRRRLDVCLLSECGEHLDQLAVPPDGDSLRTLARRISEVHGEPVTAAIESMTGARFVQRDLVPAIWLPDPRVREERELARFRLHLIKHRTALKNRIHSTMIGFGRPCPVSDLFGVEGRRLLERLEVPEPWLGDVVAALELIDHLGDQITAAEKRLRAGHADHPYIPLLMSAPGIGWTLAFTIGSEIGEIERFASPAKLTGYSGLCPRVNQSGEKDRRGPLSRHGPRYLRWALIEATMHALRHPAYAARYERTKRRLGKQRGSKVAQIEVARRLSHAIWHMLTRNEEFAPRGAEYRLAA